MTTRTIFAGFGGQGVLLMGYILSHGAMLKGLNVTFMPAYGAEMRGGTANCTVTVSDEEIDSPVTSEPDVLVAMNYPSLAKFEPMVRPGGTILVNHSLIPEKVSRKDVVEVRVPLVDLAREVGSDRAANMVMLGAFCAKTGLLDEEEIFQGMAQSMKGKEKFFDMNRKGIARGLTFGREGK